MQVGTNNYEGTPRYFPGIIDEVRIWNVARTSAEIAEFTFAEITGAEDNLAAYYSFNEGFGAVFHDLSPNGNDGRFYPSFEWVPIEWHIRPGNILGSVTPPFEGLPVYLYNDSGEPIDTSYTDENGDFGFLELLAGEYQLELEEPYGYAAIDNPIIVALDPGETEYVSYVLEPVYGSIEGAVTPPFEELAVYLYDESEEPVDTAYTDEYGEFEFTDLFTGEYTVELEAPYGFAAEENPIPVSLEPGETEEVGFVLEPIFGTIAGSVTPPQEGLPVSLFDELDELIGETVTESGEFTFEELFAGEYEVEIYVPLGYSADENPITAEIVAGETTPVDFVFSEDVTVSNPKGKGFWKTNFKKNIQGKGNPQYSGDELLEFNEIIFDYFYNSPMNPIQVEYVTYAGSPAHAMDLDEMYYILNINQGGSTMNERARQQFATLMLNLASGKTAQYFEASADGATIADAFVFIESLLGSEDDLAKDIAETLNDGDLVEAGIIPVGFGTISGEEPEIEFNVPLTFNFDPPCPNPFNPETNLSFSLPHNENVLLNIYDVQGRTVVTLVNGIIAAGNYKIKWNASSMPSGIYFAVLNAGNKQQTQKLLLIK